LKHILKHILLEIKFLKIYIAWIYEHFDSLTQKVLKLSFKVSQLPDLNKEISRY